MRYHFVLIFLLISIICQGQEPLSLAMDSIEVRDSRYMKTYRLDSKDKAGAVLILPGGGYRILSSDYEGTQVAKWFNERGVQAFVLDYAVGKFDGSGNKHPDMLLDAQRAIKIIRYNAEKWNIDLNKIGVIGFSAGGHLASTLATHTAPAIIDDSDVIERESSSINFCVLAYPVITMNKEYTHWGSRRFLLGPNPTKEELNYVSAEDNVNALTPPTFIFHTSDDPVVNVDNSIVYYQALRTFGIPVEMHIFEHGVHGVGLAENDAILSDWNYLLNKWLFRWGIAKP